MVERQENVFYYITLLNENYAMPGLKPAPKSRSSRACTCWRKAPRRPRACKLLGSGTILRESMAAKELLEADWGVAADVWSCPSFNELARDGQDASAGTCCTRPKRPSVPFVTEQLAATPAR
jgi:pyruvate dehydrogenase E1 component